MWSCVAAAAALLSHLPQLRQVRLCQREEGEGEGRKVLCYIGKQKKKKTWTDVYLNFFSCYFSCYHLGPWSPTRIRFFCLRSTASLTSWVPVLHRSRPSDYREHRTMML